jgi:hypothetical protein
VGDETYRDPTPRGAAAPGAIGARALHDRFCRLRVLTVVRDVCPPRYRLTLLRRDGDGCGGEEHHRTILKDAEEYNLPEGYGFASAQRDRRFARGEAHV